VQKFNDEGISKLSDAVNSDLSGIIDELKSLKDTSDNYNIFTETDDSMNANVKFIVVME
jgi:putative membrane protein